jgi:hypothetical protein
MDTAQLTLHLAATLLNVIVQFICSDDSPTGSSNNCAHSILTERRHFVATGSHVYCRHPENVKCVLTF